jgi:hypothetical protein
MAKKRGRPRAQKAGVPETVGAALGTVMAKVDAWMAQRQVLANELQQVIGRAQGMLASLGGAAGLPLGKRGRPKQGLGPRHDMSMLTAGSAPAKKRREMSAEAREKIAAAQRARWAKQKAGAGGGAASKSAKKAKRGRKAKAESANS